MIYKYLASGILYDVPYSMSSNLIENEIQTRKFNNNIMNSLINLQVYIQMVTIGFNLIM